MDTSPRGKTTPASTPGSFTAKSGSRSRVPVDHGSLNVAVAAVIEHADSRAAAESVVDAALAVCEMECDECGYAMWIDEEGDPHHKNDDDADGDHTALSAAAADFDPDDPLHVGMRAAVAEHLAFGSMTVTEIETVCYAQIATKFQTGAGS